MSPFRKRLAAHAAAHANLIIHLNELDELRGRVVEAQLSTTMSKRRRRVKRRRKN
jgi:hypothetical protein